jgi:hypothetical protein
MFCRPFSSSGPVKHLLYVYTIAQTLLEKSAGIFYRFSCDFIRFLRSAVRANDLYVGASAAGLRGALSALLIQASRYVRADLGKNFVGIHYALHLALHML